MARPIDQGERGTSRLKGVITGNLTVTVPEGVTAEGYLSLLELCAACAVVAIAVFRIYRLVKASRKGPGECGQSRD